MSKVNLNEPKRSLASESQYSLMEFAREFPDDAACLEHLWRSRFSEDGSHADCPKCERERKFHKVKTRPSWSCDTCGHHIHPTAGTIFNKSATSLQLWFYVMYVMTSTRCGVSAKAIEREIGVGYKTAWRMCNLIRTHLMEQDNTAPLTGHVEADETACGGKPKVSMTRGMSMSEAQKYVTTRRPGSSPWSSAAARSAPTSSPATGHFEVLRVFAEQPRLPAKGERRVYLPASGAPERGPESCSTGAGLGATCSRFLMKSARAGIGISSGLPDFGSVI